MTFFFLNIKQDKKGLSSQKSFFIVVIPEKNGVVKNRKKKDKAVRNWTASVQCLQFLGVSV
jgi:hypothetical protein